MQIPVVRGRNLIEGDASRVVVSESSSSSSRLASPRCAGATGAESRPACGVAVGVRGAGADAAAPQVGAPGSAVPGAAEPHPGPLAQDDIASTGPLALTGVRWPLRAQIWHRSNAVLIGPAAPCRGTRSR